MQFLSMFRKKKGWRLVSAPDLKLSLTGGTCHRGERPSGRGRAVGRRTRAAGRAPLLPRPRAVPALGASLLRQPGSPALGAQRRRHVFRGQRERSAAPGGAAQAGGRGGEDQGEAGGNALSRGAEAARSRPACCPRAARGEAGGRGRVAAERSRRSAARSGRQAPGEAARGGTALRLGRGRRRGGRCARPWLVARPRGTEAPLGWRRGLRGSRPGLVAREDRPVPARVVRDRVPLGAFHFQWCGR